MNWLRSTAAARRPAHGPLRIGVEHDAPGIHQPGTGSGPAFNDVQAVVLRLVWVVEDVGRHATDNPAQPGRP